MVKTCPHVNRVNHPFKDALAAILEHGSMVKVVRVFE